MIKDWRNFASYTCGILTAFAITSHTEHWLLLVLIFITPWPAVARLGSVAIEDIHWAIIQWRERRSESVGNKK